ncbi:MAG: hypothetical protein E7265_07650, partial [Lachnospiraceae bacterium]|nr:hypothetical protein [Lachnospiraceae bacterium]
MKKKVFRIIISYVCLVIMISSIFGVAPFGGAASKAPKLVKKKAVLYVGKKTTIRLKNGKKTAKVKWKTTNKKVASIIGKKTRGNNAYCKIKAKKPGKCNIVAKYTLGTKSKKLRCQVVVKRKGGNELISPTIYPGVNPIETTIPTMSVTNKPGDSQNPETTPNGNSGATDNTETTPDGSSGSTDNPEATPDGSSGSTDNPEATPDGSSGSTDNPEATPDGSSGSTDNPETTPTQKPVVTNAPTQKPVVTNAPTQKPV